MSENLKNSGADAPNEDLNDSKFHEILNGTVEELLEMAWKEEWKIKHVKFWLDVKQVQALEKIVKRLRVMGMGS